MNGHPEKTKAFRELLKLTGRAIGEFDMIPDGSRILIGLSGGKDSFMLCHLLHELRRKAPVRFSLDVVTFDPGFKAFGMPEIAAYCRAANWRHHVLAMPVEEIIREKEFSDNPCVLCSRLRRGRLYRLAGELGCTAIALGHHLDDAIISFLMSLFRGQGLTTMGPNVAGDGGSVRLIRPMIFAPESLVKEAASAFALPESGKCRFAGQLERDGDRAFFRRRLQELEERIPHFRSQVLHSLGNIREEYLLDRRFLKK